MQIDRGTAGRQGAGETRKKTFSVQLLLADLCCRLGAFLSPEEGEGGKEREEEMAAGILSVVREIRRQQGVPGLICILCNEGVPPSSSGDAEGAGYTARSGRIVIDRHWGETLSEDPYASFPELPQRLFHAFHLFGALGIYALRFLPWAEDPAEEEAQGAALRYLKRSLKMAAGHGVGRHEEEGEPRVLLDEDGRIDGNLGLLALRNGLDAERIRGLVRRVALLLGDPRKAPLLGALPTAYEVLLGLRVTGRRLARPNIELNNFPRWVAEWRGCELGTGDAVLVRACIRLLKDLPLTTGHTLKALFGSMQGHMHPEEVAGSISWANRLLVRAKETDRPFPLEAALSMLRARLREVRGEVIERLIIQGNSLQWVNGAGRPRELSLEPELSGLVAWARMRHQVRKKTRRLLSGAMTLQEGDWEILGEDLGMGAEKVRDFLGALARCVDGGGNLQRGIFERVFSEAGEIDARHFAFLWDSLKDTVSRKSRIATLNGLRSLAMGMRDPDTAVRLLLEDVLSLTQGVAFSDRNALMLANLLLRAYNKEARQDIEVTPEEVLLIRNGLQAPMVVTGREALARNAGRMIEKLETALDAFRGALEGTSPSGAMPVRHLAAFQRELYLFLALLGGPLSHALLLRCLKLYGDPRGALYRTAHGAAHFALLLNLLRVLVRGTGRFGDRRDLPVFEGLAAEEGAFVRIAGSEEQRRIVGRVFRWVAETREGLSRGS